MSLSTGTIQTRDRGVYTDGTRNCSSTVVLHMFIVGSGLGLGGVPPACANTPTGPSSAVCKRLESQSEDQGAIFRLSIARYGVVLRHARVNAASAILLTLHYTAS